MTVSHPGDDARIRGRADHGSPKAQRQLVSNREDASAACGLPVRKAPAESGVNAGAKRGKRISDAEFRRLWLDPDVPAQAIADRLGITVQAVRLRAMARKLPKRKGGGGKNRKINPALFREMWAANVGMEAMARFFGVHPNCITKRRTEWGLPRRACSRWNSISVAGFLLAKAAHETEAALAMAEMVDGRRTGGDGRRAA